MKILLTSDWHLKGSNPENRIDSFFLTQLGKIEQVFKIFNEGKCQYLLQAGDLFDHPRPSFEVLQYIIELFNKYNINNNNFLCVAGQHDTYFRNIEKTALRLMEALNYITICKKHKFTEDVHLYGASWGDEIPIIKDKDNFNILLIHKTIINKPQWFGQEEYLQSDKFFKHGFDIVVAGDNHIPVFYQYKDQTIVGCGTISRKTISEVDLVPHIYILDINESDLTYDLKKIELNYEPANKVFKQEALERKITKENEKLQMFIENIKNNEISKSLDFKSNLEKMMSNTEEAVKEVILKELETITE